MTELALTRHAEVRLSQRGLRDADISFLMDVATPLARNEWLLTNADVDREVTRHKQEIQQLQRLRGVKLVVAGDVVVTAYHSCGRDQRRTLRRGRHAR